MIAGMGGSARKLDRHHGLGDPGLPRYFALYVAQAGWLVLGYWLLRAAQWPSTCTPAGLSELYGCAGRLPESGRWHEYALLTWLWATPLLVLLDLARRMGVDKA